MVDWLGDLDGVVRILTPGIDLYFFMIDGLDWIGLGYFHDMNLGIFGPEEIDLASCD